VPIEGPVPGAILSWLATSTVLVVMFHLGTMVVPSQLRAAWRSPAPMLKALFSSVVAVPVVVVFVARAFELPRAAQVGIVLMAICPGAPMAVKRALGAGADAAFALALQVSIAFLVVITVPLSIAVLNEVYAGSAFVEPWRLALQVFAGQLLPLALGMASRAALGPRLHDVEPLIGGVAAVLLLVLAGLALVDAWEPVRGAGLRVGLAVAVATLCALAIGHFLGGPEASLRTTVAVASAARNLGLALVVAIANKASPAIIAAVLAYFAISALTATPYVAFRRSRAGARPARETA